MSLYSSIKKSLLVLPVFVFSFFFSAISSAQSTSPVAADVIVVVDESGSMSGEQAWLREAIPLLEEELLLYGVGSEAQENFWGLVGFGNNRVVPRSFFMNGNLFGNAEEFSIAARGLVINGGTEDGWRGIQFAIDQYPRRNGAALNIILATDEDRDNTISSITFASVLEALNNNRALLNAVVNVRLFCEDNTPALGMDSQGNGYVADGAGGFATCENPRATSGSGATINHYVNLALENGGAVWDLDYLRRGGFFAESFTRAVLSIKVDEILSQRPLGDLVAIAQANPNPAVANQSISLNGANSYHQVEGRSIVNWEWDLDNDGIFDATGPTISTSFPATGIYPVTLRVSDDAEIPVSAQVTIDVDVNLPPLKPTANIGGPYLFCPQNTPWRLDATASLNPDDGLSEEGLPGDSITSYVWDLDNDLAFDDAEGALVDATSVLETLGVGDHLIRLRVEDNTATSFPASGLENLFDTAFGQVSILDESDARCNCLSDLATRPKFTKVQLTWSDSGAAAYAVYRSETEGGPYTEIARTDNRYSTYLDMGLTLDETYYYVVSELGNNGLPLCRSREVSATPTARRLNPGNRAPTIDSSAILTATEGTLYQYDVEASDPDARETLTYTLQLAPSGMTIDGATGLIEWTPLNSQVGAQTVVVRVADNQGLFDEQVYTVTVANLNQAPLINSTPVTEGTELAPYSYAVQALDPDLGDSLNYSLSVAPVGMVINANSGVITWTPELGQIGDFNVTIVVTDSSGASDTQSFVVNVIERNLPPTITSTPLVNAQTETQYSYQVTATDPNSTDTLIFSLGDFPEGMAIDADTGLASWIPTASQIGSFPVSVIVTDPRSGSATQNFSIDVVLQNVAPEFVTTALDSAIEDSPYRFTVSATDANTVDGDTITYSIVSGPGGLVIDALSGELQWLPTEGAVGDNTVVLRATDSTNLFAEQSFNLNVANVNDAPAITSEPVITPLNSDELFQYQVIAEDSDVGDVVSLSLSQSPAGMNISASGLISWQPTLEQAGDFTVTVVATDLAGLFDEQTFVLSVSVPPTAPEINSSPVTTGETGVLYQYLVSATDANGDVLTYSLSQAPAGMSIDASSGLISWTPADNQAGNFNVSVQVADPGLLTDTQSYTIAVAQGNRAPQITSAPTTVALVDQLYTYIVLANDADGDALTYSLLESPLGMSMSPTGEISWTPTNAQIGTHSVSVRVADPNGAETTQTYGIVVALEPNDPPAISSVPGTSATVDSNYVYQIVASDPNDDTLTFSLTTAPTGMTINVSSGLLSWLPTSGDEGLHDVSIRVEDGRGGFATQSYQLAVSAIPNEAPSITSTPTTTVEEGVAYSYSIVAVDPEGDTLTYSLVSGPAAMLVDSSSGALSWAPTSADVGNHPVVVRATDPAGAYAQQSFSLTVLAQGNEAPTITSTPSLNATTGELYQYQLEVVDADGDAITFSLDVSPFGMSINENTGLLTWTPAENQSGSHTVTVRANDGRGGFATQTYTVNVGEVFGLPLEAEVNATPQFVEVGETVTIGVWSQGGEGPISYTLLVNGVVTPLISGTATIVATDIGRVDLELTVTDGTDTVVATNYFSVGDPSDVDSPVAQIDSPVEHEEILKPVAVIGTANDANFAAYRLLISERSANQYTEIASGDSPVIAGELGTLDPTVLKNGIYDLVLQVIDINGQETIDGVVITVDGEMKLGEFAFTVEDVNIPVAGIPVYVARTYNTRQRQDKLSFGQGWSVNYQNVRIIESRRLGQYWEVIDRPYMFFLRTYCVEPIGSSPYVFVETPDGKMHKFDVVASIGGGSNCQDVNPAIVNVSFEFQARTGTYSTLESNEYSIMRMNGNNLANYDETFGEIADPDAYTLTTEDGYVYQLNQNFGVTSVTDPYGNSLTYAANGVTHSSGKGIAITRDSENRITEIVDPNGNTVQYQYDANGNLARVIDQVGDTTDYTYYAGHYLNEIINNNGVVVARAEFDDAGRLSSLTDGDGGSTITLYDLDNNQQTVIDPLGRNWLYTYDDFGRITEVVDPTGDTTFYSYDEFGNEIEVTNADQTITRTYDSRGQITEEFLNGELKERLTYDSSGNVLTTEDGLGRITNFTYNSGNDPTRIELPGGRVIQNQYTAAGVLNRVVNPDGSVVSLDIGAGDMVTRVVDAMGVETNYAYDNNNNQTTEVRTRTVDGIEVTETISHAYDGKNNKTGSVFADGTSISMSYDQTGRMTSMVGRAGREVQTTYDDRGFLSTATTVTGKSIAEEYDGAGNLISETDEYGYTTQHEYDVYDRLIKTTYSDGRTIEFLYDLIGNKVGEKDANGNWTTFTYYPSGALRTAVDPDGNETQYFYDLADRLTSEIDALGNTTSYEYDVADNLVTTTYPGGATVSHEYDLAGRVTKTINELGNETEYAYDAMGRLIQVIDAEGGETNYQYDEFGNLVAEIDANGNTTSLSYDSDRAIVSRTLPMGQTEYFVYGDQGELLTRTGFNGDIESRTYNEYGVLAQVSYADGDAVIYEEAEDGSWSRQTDASGGVTYFFDSNRRVTRVTDIYNQSIDYAYDNNGNVVSVITPHGNYSYTYDSRNNMLSASDPDLNVTTYTYDALNRLTQTLLPNGVTVSQGYDARSRVVSIEYFDPLIILIDRITYSYDLANNRTSTTYLSGRTETYTYDALSRLLSENVVDAEFGNFNVSYTYDAVGNRISSTGSEGNVSYSYDLNNRLTTAGAATYSYAANGNLLNKSEGASNWDYNYDARNRLTSASVPGNALEYTYGPDNNRFGRTANGVAQRFLVDQNRDYAQVLASTDTLGSLEDRYHYGVRRISENGNYFLSDAKGSTIGLTGNDGNLNGRLVYDAFGQQKGSSGVSTNFGYNGEQMDAELGMQYLRARYYDPSIGRFSQMDTWNGVRSNPITLNKYLYADANPVMNIDPSGNFSLGSLSVGMNIMGRLAVTGFRVAGRAALSCAKTLARFYGRVGVAAARGSERTFLRAIKGAGNCGALAWATGFGVAHHSGAFVTERMASYTVSWNSFGTFKNKVNRALFIVHANNPLGMDWHHIVEKTQRFRNKSLHSIANLVPTPRPAHRSYITPYYSRHYPTLGTTLRNWLTRKNYSYQWRLGIKVWANGVTGQWSVPADPTQAVDVIW